jgi:precorrin-8X/cobalt-precorrin-8 methylmutase
MGVHPIEAESYRILAQRVDLSGWPAEAAAVVARMIHASADESFATSTRIGPAAVDAACRALLGGAAVVCDTAMVLAGLGRLPQACCHLGEVPSAPTGSTRAAIAIHVAARRHPDGAIWVIGNAPTALSELLLLHAAGQVEPAAVIGLPVGYVGAAEAKAALWAGPLADRSITNLGERGGSPVAVAALNAVRRLCRPPEGASPTGGPER